MIFQMEMTVYRSWKVSNHKGRFYATANAFSESLTKGIQAQTLKKLDKVSYLIVMIIIINKQDGYYPAITPRTTAGGGKSFEKKAATAQIDLLFTRPH